MRFLAALIVVVGCQHADVAERSAELTSKASPPAVETVAPTKAPTPEAHVCGCGGGGQCGGQCGGGCMAGEAPAWGTVPATAAWTALHVTGMHCGGCAKRIERALAGTKGVLAVKVDLASAKVEVATASGIDARALATPTIDGLGYHVE